MTYPDADLVEYVSTHLVAYKSMLNRREDWPLFRAHHIIWTPTLGVMDRNGGLHYQSPGFLPPSEFLSALRIGRARCLMAWTRAAEAAHELEIAAEAQNSFTPEALFWLGTARFFERRDSTGMYEVWRELVARYPDSPWAKRTYPSVDR